MASLNSVTNKTSLFLLIHFGKADNAAWHYIQQEQKPELNSRPAAVGFMFTFELGLVN